MKTAMNEIVKKISCTLMAFIMICTGSAFSTGVYGESNSTTTYSPPPAIPRPIFTCYFNANKGKVSTKSKLVQYSNIFGSLPKPTRSKYTFRGWYTAKKGGKEITQYSRYYGDKNVTLYARWQKTTSYEKEVMKHINAQRKKKKLVKLKWDKKIYKGTKTRATEITKKFSHVRPNGGSGARYLLKFVKKGRSSGECLGKGFDDPKKLVTAFMNSPSHKRIIMMKKARSVGVASKVKGGVTYWCVGTSALYKK